MTCDEPVQCEDDIVRFCEETGLPVALDETIDKIHGNIPDSLARFTHPGVVALVIKPSVVGGFENAALISLWAQAKGKLAVVSAAFESSISLSSYVQFACYLEMRSKQIPPTFDKKLERSVAHGLGTYKWLKEDVVFDPLVICRQPHNGYLGASIDDADNILRNFQINRSVTSENFVEGYVYIYEVTVELQNFCWLIKVQETGDSRDNNVLLFLHGFLGSSEDWIPIMKGLSRSAKCVSVDLPGHGKSKIHSRDGVKAAEDVSLSIEVVAAVLSQLINKIAPGKVTLVGYSMGARIALYMALRFSGKINGAIVISGSPGLEDVKARKTRAAIDDSRARSLLSFGLRAFVNTWYHGDMWQSFRKHPNFKKIVTGRLQHDDVHGLAKALSDLSIGKQPTQTDFTEVRKEPHLVDLVSAAMHNYTHHIPFISRMLFLMENFIILRQVVSHIAITNLSCCTHLLETTAPEEQRTLDDVYYDHCHRKFAELTQSSLSMGLLGAYPRSTDGSGTRNPRPCRCPAPHWGKILSLLGMGRDSIPEWGRGWGRNGDRAKFYPISVPAYPLEENFSSPSVLRYSN
ncbi:hypothetical protein Cgig2_022784 [Carnegiea gigantea]|uniref:AB hydrolase-1 domain-containing protein n=1 Tax=Carnegiea gigantea TaxID=171969 RepID=A0A9Q1KDN8_9CARY|nr:hypothetical protein Cgig2_022784 [Carnegiea gigantea]